MKIKKTWLLLLCLPVVFCQWKKKATFILRNKTTETVDSIRLTTSSARHLPAKYLQLRPAETRIYQVDMTEVPQVDGNYVITYKRAASAKMAKRPFGYFTNGYPHEDSIRITILADTVLFRHFTGNSHY